MLKTKKDRLYTHLTGVFCLILGLFSHNSLAAVVRFPIFPGEVPLERPTGDIQKLPKTVRILNPSLGSYFHSTAIEFEAAPDGSLKRSKTYSIDYLTDAMRVPTKKACEAILGSDRNQELGQIFLDAVLAGTSHRRIDGQSLSEMAARGYLDPGKLNFYRESAEGAHPDGFIFLESLSWMPAKDVKAAFGGKIPWERVAELDSPYDSVPLEELRTRVESGDEKIKVRIRRATLRIALGMMYQDHWMGLSRARLPWEEEARAKGKPGANDEGVWFRFEFGRASQIPGLESEALQLGGVAALVAAYYAQVATPPGKYLDLNQVRINFHALKPTHVAMYKRWLGAEVLPGHEDPNDSVLEVTVEKMIEKTFAKSGMFRDFAAAVPADRKFYPETFVKTNRESMSHHFYTFNWFWGNEELTPTGPLLMIPSEATTRETGKLRVQSSRDPVTLGKWLSLQEQRPKQDIISPKRSAFHDNSLVDLPKELKETHDMYVSGFNSNFMINDSKYLLKIGLTVPKYFNNGVGKNILFVSKNWECAKQAKELGFKVWEFTGRDHRVRFAVSATYQQLLDLREKFPQDWAEAKDKSQFSDTKARTYFSLVNLDGLI